MSRDKTVRNFTLSGRFESVAREAGMPDFLKDLASHFTLESKITTEEHFFRKEDVTFSLSGRLQNLLQAKKMLISAVDRYNQRLSNHLERC